MKIHSLSRVAVALLTASLSLDAQTVHQVTSPDGRNVVQVGIREGHLYYAVQRAGRDIIMPSLLGFEFRGQPPLRDSLRFDGMTRRARDTTWTQPWGEVARVRDNHNELHVDVQETTGLRRRFGVTFRVFNDGVGFRYQLPTQENLAEFDPLDGKVQNAEALLVATGRAFYRQADRRENVLAAERAKSGAQGDVHRVARDVIGTRAVRDVGTVRAGLAPRSGSCAAPRVRKMERPLDERRATPQLSRWRMTSCRTSDSRE